MWLLFLIFGLVAAGVPWFSQLLSPLQAGLFLVLGIAQWRVNRWLATAFIALAVATLHGHYYLQQRLPITYQGQDITMSGCVESLVSKSRDYQQFDFVVYEAMSDLNVLTMQGRIKLLDYQFFELRPGHCYTLTVRLKRIHRNVNFDVANRERNDVANHILAKGYVRSINTSLGIQTGLTSWILRQRAVLQTIIIESPLSRQGKGWLAALILGDKSQLLPAQWETLKRTGTVHVVVVSGLHVGLMATVGGAVFYVISWCWPASYRFASRRVWAGSGGLFAGVLFAMLCGMGMPVQRATLMLFVFVLMLWFRREAGPWLGWAVSLCVVVTVQPFGSLSLGFLLSFALVAALLGGVSAQAKPWQQWLSAQWRCMIVSMPLLVSNVGAISILAPLVNIVFVPCLAILLPAVLLLFLVSFVWSGSWWWLQQLFTGLDVCLAWLASLSWSMWQAPSFKATTWLALLMTCVLLLLPNVWRWRYLAGLPLLSILLVPHRSIEQGLRIDFFDIGQGSAVLLQTANWRGLYDTGPRYGEYTAFKGHILPALTRQGLKQLDNVWISHRDTDHAGGLGDMLENLDVEVLNAPAGLINNAAPCKAGEEFSVDGVSVEVLWPPIDYISKTTNNTSCVLQITFAGRRILLPGDIEREVEERLLDAGKILPTDIMSAPHHGSKTSSSLAFVKSAAPQFVVFEAGYMNRYGHPVADVMERYRSLVDAFYMTGDDGAVRFSIDSQGAVSVLTARQARRYFWYD